MDYFHPTSKKRFMPTTFPELFIVRQGKYCNNLTICQLIPFFIASKSSVGKTILETVLPHFSKDSVA